MGLEGRIRLRLLGRDHTQNWQTDDLFGVRIQFKWRNVSQRAQCIPGFVERVRPTDIERAEIERDGEAREWDAAREKVPDHDQSGQGEQVESALSTAFDSA